MLTTLAAVDGILEASHGTNLDNDNSEKTVDSGNHQSFSLVLSSRVTPKCPFPSLYQAHAQLREIWNGL